MGEVNRVRMEGGEGSAGSAQSGDPVPLVAQGLPKPPAARPHGTKQGSASLSPQQPEIRGPRQGGHITITPDELAPGRSRGRDAQTGARHSGTWPNQPHKQHYIKDAAHIF
ncbi:hypothetical protein CRENBAI_010115 [Crenichthys baileyi]|uniref:Uncharacterized protein n=1 Tax=Crenichthys baileyi TaxID=28760 RepID=A0AAV9R6Z1_9TELE